MQVDVDKKQCIVSAKEAIQAQAVRKYKQGDTVDVRIDYIVPYGAFGSIKNPETGAFDSGNVRTCEPDAAQHPFPCIVLVAWTQQASNNTQKHTRLQQPNTEQIYR